MAQRRLVVHPSKEAMGSALADAIAEASSEAIAKKGKFTIAFSGGSLPDTVNAGLLATKQGIEYNKWHVFFCDERCVPHDHADSNYKLIKDGIMTREPIQHVYTINPSYLDQPDQAASDYEEQMKRVFGNEVAHDFPSLDMALLGMGPDGHTCSLFPGHHLLQEKSKWVAAITDSPKPPPNRITLTLPVVNASKHIIFVATGASKQEPLREIFGGHSSLPAALIMGANGVDWYVDEEAAAAIT